MSEEKIYDRRYLRNRLKELGKDNIEITAFRSGEPNKENPLYEVSRVIEYAINGAVMTSNIQVLSIIYNLCVTLIANFHLTPSENMEKFIDKVEDLKKEQQKMEDLENLKDLGVEPEVRDIDYYFLETFTQGGINLNLNQDSFIMGACWARATSAVPDVTRNDDGEITDVSTDKLFRLSSAHMKDGNPKNNSRKNLRVESKKTNRSRK